LAEPFPPSSIEDLTRLFVKKISALPASASVDNVPALWIALSERRGYERTIGADAGRHGGRADRAGAPEQTDASVERPTDQPGSRRVFALSPHHSVQTVARTEIEDGQGGRIDALRRSELDRFIDRQTRAAR
jgi:hypothetical protein